MSHRTVIDWSHWQDDPGTPAFPDLSAATRLGVDGHLFRAGRGHDPDPAYQRFVTEARQRGLPWGAYWWPEPCLSTPTDQAAFTWREVSRLARPDLPLDIDVEGHRGDVEHPIAPYRALSPNEQAGWLRAYVNELRRLSGRSHIIIYTADWYWNRKVAPAGVSFADCDLRVAHYLPGTPPQPAAQWTDWIAGAAPDIPSGWSTWSAWQFSANGNRAGRTYGAESGDLDLNVVRTEVWRRWVRPTNPAEVDVAQLPTVRAGMSGPSVSIVQALVNVHLAGGGRPQVTEDGVWPSGSASPTSRSVVWFQSAKGLTADGVVGPRTWSALLGLP